MNCDAKKEKKPECFEAWNFHTNFAFRTKLQWNMNPKFMIATLEEHLSIFFMVTFRVSQSRHWPGPKSIRKNVSNNNQYVISMWGGVHP